MESKEIYIAYNVELGRIFKVGYGLPKNPQNYTWMCRTCKKPVFYNQYERCFKHRGKKPEDFEHTLIHEIGHNLYFNHMTAEDRTAIDFLYSRLKSYEFPSERAEANPAELWAESYALYYERGEDWLPKKVQDWLNMDSNKFIKALMDEEPDKKE